MDKPMPRETLVDQTITRSRLNRNSHCKAFQTVTPQTNVMDSTLTKSNDGNCVTFSDGTDPDGWSFHLEADER